MLAAANTPARVSAARKVIAATNAGSSRSGERATQTQIVGPATGAVAKF